MTVSSPQLTSKVWSMLTSLPLQNRARTNYPKLSQGHFVFSYDDAKRNLKIILLENRQGISPVFNWFSGTKPKLTNLILFLQYLLHYMFCWQHALFIIIEAHFRYYYRNISGKGLQLFVNEKGRTGNISIKKHLEIEG